MRRKLLRKSHVRKTVKYLRNSETHKIDIFSGLDDSQKKYFIIRILWVFLIGISLSICMYQIHNRIAYFLSEPVVVDSCNEIMKEGDMFMVTICTDETDDFLRVKFRTTTQEMPLFDAIKFMKINADQLWKLRNTTTVIKDAYYSKDNKKFRNAVVKDANNEIGLCTNIFNGKNAWCAVFFELHCSLLADQPLPLGDFSLTLHIIFYRGLYFTLYTEEKESVLVELHSQRNIVLLGNLQLLQVTLEKFLLLNRRTFLCAKKRDYEECIEKCRQDFYNEQIENCSFPFIKLRGNIKLPSCDMSEEIAEQLRHLHYSYFGDTQDIDCEHCGKPCEKTLTHFVNDFSNIKTNEIRMNLQSTVVRKLCERLSYDFISLLCDIGGNLGLFLGISCLSLMDLSSDIVRWITYKNELKKLSKKSGFKLVAKIYEFERNKNKKLLTSSNSNSKKFTTVIKIFAFFICSYQTYERITYYFSYPIHSKIKLAPAEVTMSVVSCVGSNKSLTMMDEFAKKYNKSNEQVDLLDLLDEHSEFSNVKELWLMSSDLKEHTPHGGYAEMLPDDYIKTPIATPFGNCTELPDIVIVSLKKKNYKIKNFFIPVDQTINYKEHLIFYCDTFNSITYKTQLVIKENTPAHPCVTDEEADRCEQECYFSKLLKKNIACSLPYMNVTSLNLQLCSTTKSARESADAYIDAYMNTDAAKQCSCKLRCNVTLFWTTLSEVIEPPHPGVSIIEYTQKGSRVEVMTQELSFPLVKLFCDIGSNFGTILGVSLLSIFELIHTVVQGVKFLTNCCLR